MPGLLLTNNGSLKVSIGARGCLLCMRLGGFLPVDLCESVCALFSLRV